MNIDQIYSINKPWLHLSKITEMDKKYIPSYLYKHKTLKTTVRVLRGNKMITKQGLMDEFGAALQFPDIFGENWYALKDCLECMDEWIPTESYILVVTDAHEVLTNGDDEDFHWLLVTLQEAGEYWSKPISDNGRFNRNAVPFHVIFKCTDNQLEAMQQRFIKEGVDFNII